ncbi:MAG: DUF5060 domain-containing protein [Saccharofermentanales bacterium]
MEVKQWQVAEITYHASLKYPNPYKDVIADVVFEHPESGVTFRRPVFWDGQDAWKVRFAPTAIGKWDYHIASCNVKDSGFDSGVHGELLCKAPDDDEKREIYRHGFLKIYDIDDPARDPSINIPDVNRRFLTYADGKPFFWSSGTMGNMVSCLNRWKNRDPGSDDHSKGEFQICVDALIADGNNVIKGGFDEFTSCGSDVDFKPNSSIFPFSSEKRFSHLTEEDIINIRNELDFRIQYLADRGVVWHTGVVYADLIYIDETEYSGRQDCKGIISDRLDGYKEWIRYIWARYGAYPVVFGPAWEAPGYYNWHPAADGTSIRDERIDRFVKLWNYTYSLIGGYQLVGGLLTMSYPVSRYDGTKEINHTMVYELIDLPSFQIMVPMQGNWEQDPEGWMEDFYTVCKDYWDRQPLKPLLVDETWYDGFCILEDDNNKDASKIDIVYSGKDDWQYHQETDLTAKRPLYSENGMHFAVQDGASASMTFYGTFLRWISDKGPDRGKAKVYIDGSFSQMIDLYSPVLKTKQSVFQMVWETASGHTVKIEVFDPENTKKQVVIDSIDHGDSYIYQHDMWLHAQVGCGFNYSMWGVASNGTRDFYYESLKNCTYARGRIQKVIDFYTGKNAPGGWQLDWWKLRPMWLEDNWASWTGKGPKLPCIKGDNYAGEQGFKDILIYYPVQSPVDGVLYNLSLINGRIYQYVWYDPGTGEYSDIGQSEPVVLGKMNLPQKPGSADRVLWMHY